MPDVHSPETRSRNMAAIKGRNTHPETLLRSKLHRLGFRFRTNDRKLPGSPDIVLKKYNAVVFVNGCFWHGHDCPMFRWPVSRREFWRAKISKTKVRDLNAHNNLTRDGWRICIVWECALKGRLRLPDDQAVARVDDWLKSERLFLEICGN